MAGAREANGGRKGRPTKWPHKVAAISGIGPGLHVALIATPDYHTDLASGETCQGRIKRLGAGAG